MDIGPNITFGFIGLGQMGHGMAKNLRQRIPETCALYIYDINTETASNFKDEFGNRDFVVIASSPREVGEKADIIPTSLPRAQHVQDVFLNETSGLLTATRQPHQPPILFLELSTIDATVSSQLNEEVTTRRYGHFVDAPCSGGSMGAEKATLSFMVGSPSRLYPRIHALLSLLGKPDGIFHCGDPGTGLKTKLLNNYLSSTNTIATAEPINIGIRAGLDPHLLNDVLNASSGMSFNSKVNNPVLG